VNLVHQLQDAARRGRALFSRTDRRRIIAVADLENLAYSARDAGERLDLPGLTEELLHAGAVEFHSVASATRPMLAFESDLKACGWTPHFRPLPTTHVARANETSNADSAVAAMAAGLCAARRSAALVLLTGDGGLGADIAWSIGQIIPGMPICVVAYRMALSWHLTPQRNPYIAGAFTIERRRSIPSTAVHRAPREISRARAPIAPASSS
jgi:hypothetical protein